ncbi:MAG: ABC transporter substrate-binding protein [Chloroflexi bacterium]|nr:ABC transporter substrate-binding protein [Chloroflexota bacterium]
MSTPTRYLRHRCAQLLALAALGILIATSCTQAAPATPTVAAKPTAAPTAAPVQKTSPASPTAKAAVSPTAKPTSAPAASSPAKLEKVKYAASASASSSGAFIGLERGYYRELGIDLEIVMFSNAAEMIQPTAASQVDIANADTGAGIFNALGRGLPLRFVADGNHTAKGHSSLAWVVRKDLIDSGAIKDLPDLKGKKISPIAKGSLVDSLAFRTLEKAGLKESDVDFQYVTFPDVLPAFSNKALDAAILIEPLVTSAVDKGLGVRWHGMDELFGSFQSTLIMFSPNMSTQRQEIGKRFMVGYLHGLRDYLDAFDKGKDLDVIIPILTKYTNIKDPALYKKIVVPAFDPNGKMDVESIKALQQFYVEKGHVTQPVKVEQFFDTSYLDYALSTLGRR